MSGPEYDNHIDSESPLAWWAVPFGLAVLIPGMWWTYADQPFAFRPDLFLTMTAFVALVAVILVASISRWFRHRIRWSLGVSTVALIILFQWSSLTSAGAKVADAAGVGLLADIVPVAIAGAFVWLAVRRADELVFAAILGVAVAGAVVALVFSAFAMVAPAPEPVAVSEPAGTRPVLLLVLDGYGRADFIHEEYGYDNSPFLDQLEERGFEIASEATANYSYTFASVSSMLDLEYVFPAGPIQDDHRERMRGALTGATGLAATVRDSGYGVAYVQNAWGGSQCGSGVDWCVRDGLVGRAAWNLGQMTIFAPVFNSLFRNPFNAHSIEHLEALPQLLSEAAQEVKPMFVFAHLLLPHQPLLLNSDCTRSDPGPTTRWGSEAGELLEARRSRYASQVRCVNTMVLEAIDRFISARPDAIVMITADHGPGSLLDVNLPFADLTSDTVAERMRILSAYRVEGCPDQPYESITPVNGARLIANCAAGKTLSLLPDNNYWADLDADGTVIDITGQVQR